MIDINKEMKFFLVLDRETAEYTIIRKEVDLEDDEFPYSTIGSDCHWNEEEILKSFIILREITIEEPEPLKYN